MANVLLMLRRYGAFYLRYLFAKWSILVGLYLLFSQLDGVSRLWLLGWPLVTVPVVMAVHSHLRLHPRQTLK